LTGCPSPAELLPSEEEIAMIYLAVQIASKETAADKREFLKGVHENDKVNLSSLAAGALSGTLLLKGKKRD
jgi:hypothetical protein